ncbi:rho family gtpase 3 [Ophiostoma piceae UAMH 11346]|uniref:Rho family gtpase 3 n=1 Tax=Ophiostoma piceae (strain UAMH 11346) TaxID=1262450 RepID=S3CMK6_OPHP1|nr:rho family gtpase 3 [Ophiostoma piceae UAMH 11346]
MASYAVAATPPSTAGRRDGKYWHMPVYPQHQLQPLCMSPSPSPWVDAPPTPQDSQASACHSPRQSPRTLPALLAENISTPALEPENENETDYLDDDFEEDNILISNGNAAMTASLRRSQPTLITIGPKIVGRESREIRIHQDTREPRENWDNTQNKENTQIKEHKNNREIRMQQWLSEIPAPVTPQERYIQGLNPAVDHPLHPRPLRAHPVPSRQARYLSSTELSIEDDDLSAECEKLTIAGSDKENATIRNRLQSLDASENIKPAAAMASKKRQVSEDSMEAAGARKRTKLLDPVRRFSQRLSSSLALSGVPEYERRDSGNSDDLSPEDLARQSEQLYKFSKLRRVPTGQSRLSFSKPSYGSLRSQGTNTLRRMMSSKMTLPMTPPERDSNVEFWTEGRPDMIVNVAFIGDARVGKTALIKRLVHGSFPQTYSPSDLQEQTLRLVVDGTRVQLNLSEGGSGRDPHQPSILALGWYSVVVLCYDISQQTTLQSLQKYRNEIAMYEENSTVIMAGLKKDARHRLPPLQLSFMEQPVQVERETANDVAMKLGCANYFECSSLSSCDGVDGLFDFVVQSGVDLQRARNKTMARFRFERSVDKGMTKIAEGVRSLFTFHGSS